MATSSDQVHGHQYVDFDEYIDIQLRKTGSTIKTTDVMTAVVGILTLVTLYLLFFVILDHWVVPGGFGPVTRGIMLAVVGSAACAWLIWKIVLPWRRRVSGLYAASTIEKASPALKSSLLNLVDMSRSGHHVSPEIYQSIERRAALALTHVDVNEAVDRRSLLRLSNVLLAVVVLFCLYWIFSPKNPATSLWRAIVPSADVGVATRTEIFNVQPGDKDVLARSQLEVTADVRGEIPGQTFLYFTTADRKFVDERVEMRLENEATRKFRCVLTGDNGGGILQNMTYRIVAGDATTLEYSIRVIQPPAATIESIRLDSPAYTRREPVVQTTGAIDALEGTRVSLKARANMPLRSPASLQFFDDETASTRAEEIPIRVTDGTKLDVDWKLEIRSDGTYPHYYRIFCKNTAGESDPSPSLYSLAIRPDQPPEILLLDPKTDLELPANSVLPLAIEARDPDFLLTYIDLNIEKDGSTVNGPSIYTEANAQQVKTTYRWSLAEYHFRPKDTVTYWLQAKDNRQPIANVSRTAKLRIRIIDPVSPEQVKKNLEMAEKRQKEEQQKSDAERAAQEKSNDDQPAPDRDKQQRPPQRPKNGKPGAPRPSPKDPSKRAPGAENSDDPNGQGQNGQGENGASGQQDDNGGKGQDHQKDQDPAGPEDKKPLNPDNSADDARAMQKIMDQQRREQEQEKNPSSTGKPDQGAPNKNDTNKKEGEQPKTGPDNKPQDQNDKKPNEKNQSGSPGDSGEKGNESEKKSGQGKQDESQNPSAGSKSESHESKAGEQRSGEAPKPGDKNNRSQGQPGSKQQPGPNGQKPDSTGSKPSSGNSEPNKEGTKGDGPQNSKPAPQNSAGKSAENGPKKGPENGPENAPEKRPANGAAEGSQHKEQPDKSPADEKTGAANREQRPNSDLQQQGAPKEKPSSAESPKKSGDQPDRTPNSQQPSANEGNPSSDDKNNAGQHKKNEGQSQNGAEGSDPKGNEQNRQNGPQGNQPQPRDGQSRDSKPGDSQAANRQNGNESGRKQPSAEQSTTKEPGANEAGEKREGTTEPGSKKAAGERPSERRTQSGETSPNEKPDRQQSATPRSERGDRKQTPDSDRTGDKNRSEQGRENGKEKTDASDAARGDDKNRPKPRPDDRPSRGKVNEESPRTNPQARDEESNAIRDKKNRIGGGESQLGPSGDAQEKAAEKATGKTAGKEATSPREKREQSTQETGDSQNARAQEGAGGKQQPRESNPAESKAGEGKPGSPKDKQSPQASPDQGQAGQQPNGQGQQGSQGEQGQQGQGQQGQSGQGQSGKEGQSNAASPQGGKPGPGAGQSSKGNNGGGFNNGNGGGDGAPLEDTTNQANLDYARRATDLVLNRLQDQLKRGEVDKKLEEELGWNKEQIRRFVERMKMQSQAVDDPNSPAALARRRQFEETLKTLNLRSTARRRTSQGLPKSNDAEMESKRSIPPPEYRDLYDAYTRSLAKPVPPSADDKK